MAGPAEKTCPKATTLQTSQQAPTPSMKEKLAQIYPIQLIIFSLKSLNLSYMGEGRQVKVTGKAGSIIDEVLSNYIEKTVRYLFSLKRARRETIHLVAKTAIPNH